MNLSNGKQQRRAISHWRLWKSHSLQQVDDCLKGRERELETHSVMSSQCEKWEGARR